eukprot:12934512-Prorocentrum_lima.AAC.1
MNLLDQDHPLQPLEEDTVVLDIMLEEEMEVGTAGSNTSTQGYEPSGPELELVHAQCITTHTPGGRHDQPRDVAAMGRDG